MKCKTKKVLSAQERQRSQKLYDQAQPGMLATTTTGKIGIVTEKFISQGGMYHVWLQEPGAALTPEPIDLIAKVEKKPIAVILFAGGGGVEAGMVAAGIEPILAVEYDPDKPELSSAIAASHEANFPQCKVIRRTVSECAADDFPGFPQEPDILWASPVCSNFSVAKNGEEQASDIESASAVVEAVKKLKPKHFLLENVPAYEKSESWKQIELVLPTIGYQLEKSIVDMSDYGIPQARVRFIVRASLEGKPLPLPEQQPKIGWHEAIQDLIPKLPESQLLKGQQKSVDEFLSTNEPVPLLIDRAGGRGRYRAVPAYRPTNTILRSTFTDGKNSNRTKFADIWLPDGTVKAVSIKCMARLQGFPEWYQFPEQVALAGSIIGYSVPPKFVEQLVKPLTTRRGFSSRSELRQAQLPHDLCLDEIAEAAKEMGQPNAMPTLEYGGNGNHALADSSNGLSAPNEVIEEEKMQTINLGKVFNGAAVPCPSEALNLLSSKDFIKCKDEPYCYKFLKLYESAAIGHWEGKQFSVPYESLCICHLYTESQPQTVAYSTAFKALKRGRVQGLPDSGEEELLTGIEKHENNGAHSIANANQQGKDEDWVPGNGKVVDVNTQSDKGTNSKLGISFGKTCVQTRHGTSLLKGKTVTRRIWKDSHAQKFINAFERSLRVQALDKDLRCGGQQIGWLTLTEKPYQERLSDMPSSDLAAEGFPGLSKDEFIEQFFEGKDALVWVIRFDFEPVAKALRRDLLAVIECEQTTVAEAPVPKLSDFNVGDRVICVSPDPDDPDDADPLLIERGTIISLFEEPAPSALLRLENGDRVYRFPSDLKHEASAKLVFTGDNLTEIRSFETLSAIANPVQVQTEVSALSIAEIRRDGGTQPREKLDLAHVAVLKEAIEDGAELDPVVVFYDGESYWLADGFHRCKASEESGLEDIQCIIHQGNRRDAVLYSVGANAFHKAAKPRSRADKRRAVTMLLNDPEWGKWSDREIARQCKVTHPFVSNQRKKLTGNITSENTRTYTTKHGTTTTMQTGSIGKKGEDYGASASDNNGNGNGNGEINRPANRWYGGKWRIGKWIASHFPEHKIYVEPFGGMWSVGLQKPQSEVEVYNDIHPGATNFWTRLKEDSERLIQDIDAIQWNDQTVEWAKEMTTDPFESAVKFYIQCRVAYAGGGTGWASGYSPKTFDKKENSDHSHLVAIAKRIKNLQIHAQDALDIIREFDSPDTLFYCDPPYLESTRNSHVSYEYEFDRHEELIALLGSIQGKVIISGYPSFKYASLLSSWSRKDTQGMTTSRKDATECIWIKPALPAISPDDYAIAFLTNLDLIHPDLLREARARIDQRLAVLCNTPTTNGDHS